MMDSAKKRLRDEEEEDFRAGNKRLKLMVEKGRWELEANREAFEQLNSENAEIRENLLTEMEEQMDEIQEALQEKIIEAESLKKQLKEADDNIRNWKDSQEMEIENLIKQVDEAENKVKKLEEFEENFNTLNPNLGEVLGTMKAQQKKIIELEALLEDKARVNARVSAMKKVPKGINVTMSAATDRKKKNFGNTKKENGASFRKPDTDLWDSLTKNGMSNIEKLKAERKAKRLENERREENELNGTNYENETSYDDYSEWTLNKKTGRVKGRSGIDGNKYIEEECDNCIKGWVHECFEDDYDVEDYGSLLE